MYDILQNAQYSDKLSDIGIDRLLENGVFDSAFPLHEVCGCFRALLVNLYYHNSHDYRNSQDRSVCLSVDMCISNM